jgi:hypothetical protein
VGVKPGRAPAKFIEERHRVGAHMVTPQTVEHDAHNPPHNPPVSHLCFRLHIRALQFNYCTYVTSDAHMHSNQSTTALELK